jgi:MFS transporter, ACS family, glucarate transporter
LGLLVLLFAIIYLDRVCISVAGLRVQQDLHIGPVQWRWVTAMFTLSYGLFETPTGALGNRLGARRVLTRIVRWWPVVTSLTGAFSYACIVVACWFRATHGPASLEFC